MSKKIFFILLIGVVILVLQQKSSNPKLKNLGDFTPGEEINQIKKTTLLKERVPIYKRLIERVGPEIAQEQLQRSGLPFDGETHLLNHTVGDYIYDKYKTKGLVYCKDYFLSSCYHGFVIRAIADGGTDSLTDVFGVCREKGEYVAVQCAHAIGHGLLAFDGYKNLVSALSDCDKVAEKTEGFFSYNCYDGVFMENIFAVHEDGKPSPDRWVNPNDPLYPCNEKKIPEKYINACWSNQPSLMYQQFKGDVKKVANFCADVTNPSYQTTCFDALARQIHPVTQGSVDKAFEMCSLNPGPWIDPCLISISKAFFSVGDRIAPFEICARIHLQSKQRCYSELSTIISAYIKNKKERDDVCNLIRDESWIDSCKSV